MDMYYIQFQFLNVVCIMTSVYASPINAISTKQVPKYYLFRCWEWFVAVTTGPLYNPEGRNADMYLDCKTTSQWNNSAEGILTIPSAPIIHAKHVLWCQSNRIPPKAIVKKLL